MAQKGNIWFDYKSNNFSLIGMIFFDNSWPNSLQYKYMMIPNAQETKFWPKRTLASFKIPWHSSNLEATILLQFNPFQALQSIAGGPLSRSRYSQASKTCRITTSKSRFAHFKLNRFLLFMHHKHNLIIYSWSWWCLQAFWFG